MTPSFKMTKFCFGNVEQCVALQKAMFVLGFRWKHSQSGTVRQVKYLHVSEGLLFVDKDCRMMHGVLKDDEENPQYKEVLQEAIHVAAAIHKAGKKAERKASRKRKAAARRAATSKTVTLEEMIGTIVADAGGRVFARRGVLGDRVLDPSTNPKHAIGSTALPMTMPSALFRAMVALGKANGAGKYGGANYIGTPVVMSTYLNAIQRHFDKILMGEDCDAVDGVPHWGAIGANIDIIVSAAAAGTLIDDRLRADGQLAAYNGLTPLVKSLSELHKDRTPKHFYMKDAA